jgi:hypothetical protein
MKNTFTQALLLFASLSKVLAQNAAPEPSDSNVRFRFIAPSVRPMNEYETEFKPWAFTEGPSSSITSDGLQYSIEGDGLKGGWYRVVYGNWVPHYGERMAAAGLTSASGPITLSITGLPIGLHSLKTWHNAYGQISSAAVLSIAVDGVTAVSVKLPFASYMYWRHILTEIIGLQAKHTCR